MADRSETHAATYQEVELVVETFVNDVLEKAVQYAIEMESRGYIFPSGVPGFGNSILGPRVPRVSVPPATLTMPAERIDDSDEMIDVTLHSPGNLSPNRHHRSAPVDHHEPYSTQLAGKKRKLDMLESEEHDPKTKRAASTLTGASSNPMPAVSEPRNGTITAEGEYEDEETELARLISNFKDIIHPYTLFHPTCAATEPAQKILSALSSRTLTPIAVMSLIHDALVALRPLRELQVVNIIKLAKGEKIFQKIGLDSCLNDARSKAQQTTVDIQNLEKWLAECNEMPGI